MIRNMISICTKICTVAIIPIVAITATVICSAPVFAGQACNFLTGECRFVQYESCCWEGPGWCADMPCDSAPPDVGITGPCIDPMGCPSSSQGQSENGPQLDPNGTTIMLAQLSCSEQPCAARCDCQFSSCQNWCDDIPWWNIEFWECRRGCQEDYRYCQDECAGEYGPPPAGPSTQISLANLQL